MDQNQHGQATQVHGKNQYQYNSMMAPREQQYAPQDIYQPQLNNFWAEQCQEIEESTNLKTHDLPLARIKKIMKANGNVRMVSVEAPSMFAKACEMFIMELTVKAWGNVGDHKRMILEKCDIVSAISKTNVFDFLEDIVLMDAGIPKSITAPTKDFDLNMLPCQNVAYPPNDAPTEDFDLNMTPRQNVADLPCDAPTDDFDLNMPPR